jgi:nicotinamide riboside kinase
MKIVKGKQTKPQRVVIYGVESVGKSTFAANFPAPLFLDVEGGTAHLDTTRAEIGSAVELDEALAACKGNEYQTIIIDSADWAERLVLGAHAGDRQERSRSRTTATARAS